MSGIEALYVFDEHNICILEHVWHGRPPSASTLLPLYLSHPSPRPSLLHAPDLNPPSLVYSFIQDRLLFLSPTSSDTDPIAHLEFLHRVADAFEDFLGAPLLAHKIESSYDVLAQLLGEMCDGGLVGVTEPNALRDVVEAPTWMHKLLGGVGMPASGSSVTPSLPGLSRPALVKGSSNMNQVAIPWRRSNVRHTSNEMYVDIVETLQVIMAPSGRPLSAFAHGTILFNCKVSGVPDLLLSITSAGGSHMLASGLSFPVFHPCVRLSRWRERPGELSFVPPDGRFLLAGYEVDLLGSDYLERAVSNPNPKTLAGLSIPATVDVRTELGSSGCDFEVRLLLDPKFAAKPGGGTAGRDAFSKPTGFGAKAGGTSAHPIVEEIVVRVPVPASVRNISDIRASRGEAHFSPSDAAVEWKLAGRDASALASSMHSGAKAVVATLRCSVVGVDDGGEDGEMQIQAETWEYDDGSSDYHGRVEEKADTQLSSRKLRSNRALMPGSASVSFQVRGWLASGIKVEKLVVDTQKSKGLSAGVQPFKGVKYLTVSRDGVEVRC